MNRLYLDETNNRFVLLSYAGGTKYFRHLTETKLSGYTPVNGRSLAPIQLTYSVIQVVRDPLTRYMSWFDKQYIKPMYRNNNLEFKEWINNLITKEWIDNYFKLARLSCHYDGHTNFQSVWPKIHLKTLYDDNPNWQYLKMEDIRPFFLNEKSFDPFRDPKEYVGVWESLESNTKEYLISVIKDIYDHDIQWYNNLEFIRPK